MVPACRCDSPAPGRNGATAHSVAGTRTKASSADTAYEAASERSGRTARRNTANFFPSAPTPGPVRPKPPTPAVICSAVESCQMGSDDPGTVGDAGGSGVHNQVVDDALMHLQCLQTSHPANPVRPVALPCNGDLRVATDPYPYHRKACHGCRQPLLRRSASQEDFIQDQTRPAVAYRCQTCVPGCLGPAEVLSHGHGPVRSELDGACSARRPATVWPGSDKVINLVTARQRPNEVIDAQRHPRRAQQLLQAAGDGSLARARAPVQNHYRHHPPDGTRPRQ